ncbi:MAG: hypothetical protein NT146_16710 [Mycobacterium sp.]|nr:hypothetical protein [Mycobacterium sp.]
MAVRMVLVEGEDANGATVDQHCVNFTTGTAAEHVIAGILGTRASAVGGAHRIVSTGVAWSDHAAAAELKKALRANNIDDVVLVSELHAASALAQAIGQALGCEHTALMFLERDTATLAVVRIADGAVVRVDSRSLHAADAVVEMQNMMAGLERLAHAPQAVFVVGSGIDVAALKPRLAAATTLPVHVPDDAALALSRGAALAAVNAPRFEASTVGIAPKGDTRTVAGLTQRAAVMPLGYSAVPDDAYPVYIDGHSTDLDDDAEAIEPEREPFLLFGSAMMALFVVGVFALVISLVVTIRPAAESRVVPNESAAVSSNQPVAAVPETIANPVPVVQEVPRTVFVTPQVAAPLRTAGPGPGSGGTGPGRTCCRGAHRDSCARRSCACPRRPGTDHSAGPAAASAPTPASAPAATSTADHPTPGPQHRDAARTGHIPGTDVNININVNINSNVDVDVGTGVQLRSHVFVDTGANTDTGFNTAAGRNTDTGLDSDFGLNQRRSD